MASYKVPQDVEADDKLIGPFSFRQFVYLLIVAAMGFLAFIFYKILPPLMVLPIPVIVFFGALALPLRKDQPMEIYLAAILSFYLKPRVRLWDPDGKESLVEVAKPRSNEQQLTKNISESEAEMRLRYLSNLSDSRGWSVREVSGPQAVDFSPMEDYIAESDILDDQGAVAQSFDARLAQSDQARHQQMISQFQAAAASPARPASLQPAAVLEEANPFMQNPATTAMPHFNPYPESMNQTVIQPIDQGSSYGTPRGSMVSEQSPEPSPSPTAISPDIINLANNSDLSIETIAREAHRISEKEAELGDNEVVISLR